MKKTFLIGDMHLGHANIIKYENRPFLTVEEMDDTIIKNWINVVGEEDLVFVLGDVSFYDNQKTTQIINELPGFKILILGNHDGSRSAKVWREIGFKEVYKYPILFEEFYILSHEPVYLNSNMPYVNIHGHIHSKKLRITNSEVDQFINVSVECIHYTPIDFNVIKNKILGK